MPIGPHTPDDMQVVEQKIVDLFGAVPDRVLLFVHGFNVNAEGKLNSDPYVDMCMCFLRFI